MDARTADYAVAHRQSLHAAGVSIDMTWDPDLQIFRLDEGCTIRKSDPEARAKADAYRGEILAKGVTDGDTWCIASWEAYYPGSWYLGESGGGNVFHLPEGYALERLAPPAEAL